MITASFDPNHKLLPTELDKLLAGAADARFAPDTIAADEPLWGGFWQFDVIAPGYRLPALELALLRAVRLDQNWPDPNITPAGFLAELRAAVAHPQAGVWTVRLANVPCVVFAAPANLTEVIVVWYSPGPGWLHAGYRVPPLAGHFAGLTPQRLPGFSLLAGPTVPPGWLAKSVAERQASTPAARLDKAILRWRSQKPANS